MKYFGPRSMFDYEIELRQSQGPKHKFRVRVREGFQVRKGCMVCSDCETLTVEVTSKRFGGPH